MVRNGSAPPWHGLAMLALSLAALIAAAPVAASPPEGDHAAVAEEVRIPMARFAVRTFRSRGFDTLYFRVRRDWYRATLVEPCLSLPNALRIGFDTNGSSSIDNTSNLLVDGESCRIISLVRSDPPPRRAR